MEIVNASASILCNYEVLESMKMYKSTKKSSGLRNLATITYETLQYLENTPAKSQITESVIHFIKAAKNYNLTKYEILLMVNDPPTSPLHIQLMVDDSEERLTEDQVNELIQLSQTYLVPLPETEATTAT